VQFTSFYDIIYLFYKMARAEISGKEELLIPVLAGVENNIYIISNSYRMA
jgi:hypothetical protein